MSILGIIAAWLAVTVLGGILIGGFIRYGKSGGFDISPEEDAAQMRAIRHY